MLHLSYSTAYYWYNSSADMRKGFDALCGIVQEHMHANVLEGGIYIFINEKRNQANFSRVRTATEFLLKTNSRCPPNIVDSQFSKAIATCRKSCVLTA